MNTRTEQFQSEKVQREQDSRTLISPLRGIIMTKFTDHLPLRFTGPLLRSPLPSFAVVVTVSPFLCPLPPPSRTLSYYMHHTFFSSVRVRSNTTYATLFCQNTRFAGNVVILNPDSTLDIQNIYICMYTHIYICVYTHIYMCIYTQVCWKRCDFESRRDSG